MARLQHGRILLGTGKIDGAILELRTLVGDDPSRAQAHYFLRAALLQQKKKAQAQDQFQQALKISPAHAGPSRALTELTLEDGNTQLARDPSTKSCFP